MRPYWIEKSWWGLPILASPGARSAAAIRGTSRPGILPDLAPPEIDDDRRPYRDRDYPGPAGQRTSIAAG
jgi:hypothetical protein